jgi:hypothetical protein
MLSGSTSERSISEWRTSAAVKGLPSLKVTPRRRWKRHVVGSITSQRSASSGS